VPAVDRPLPDGLVMRAARPADVEAIVALQVEAFGASDEPVARSRLAEELDGWVVVEDPAADGRIVSASVLLGHRLRLGDVVVPVGQIEGVVTAPDHRRRRLVRRQFEHHHARSAARGDLAILITGIPYLYRRLGYGYGLDYPTFHLPTPDLVEPAAGDSTVVRPAVAADLTGILRLDATRPTDQWRIVRDEQSWRRTLARARGTRFEQLVVAERDGAVVGFAPLEARPDARRLYLDPGVAADEEAVRALVAHALGQAAPHGEQVVALDNPGTLYGTTLEALGRAVRYDHAIYVRVPDAVALVDRLRPILSARLSASAWAERSGELVLSLYESGLAIAYDHGVVSEVRATEPIEDPFDSDDVGIPPDAIGALVLGRFGAGELARRVDDATVGNHGELMEVLFPAVGAEVLGDL
jgi:predicted N-acetyltransferase YhbS